MTVAPLVCPQVLLASGPSVRQVQLPARAFQLLARSSCQRRRRQSQRVQVSWLHTRSSYGQQQQQQQQQHHHQRLWQPFGERTDANADHQSKFKKQEESAVKSRHDEPMSIESSGERGGNDDVAEQESDNLSDRQPKDPRTSRSESFRKYMRMVPYPVAIVTSSDPDIDAFGDPIAWRGATVSSFNSVTISPDQYVSFNMKQLSSTLDAIRHSGLFTVHVMARTPEAMEIATLFSRGNDATPFLEPSKTSSEASAAAASNQNTGFSDSNAHPSLDVDRYSPVSFNNTATNVTNDSDGTSDNESDGNNLTVSKTTRPLRNFIRRNTYATRSLPDAFSAAQLFHIPPSIAWARFSRMASVIFTVLCEYQPSKQVEVGDHVIVVGKVLQTRGLRYGQQAYESTSPTEEIDEDKVMPNIPRCLTYAHGRYNKNLMMKKSWLGLFRDEWKSGGDSERVGDKGDGDNGDVGDGREDKHRKAAEPRWKLRKLPFG